MSWAESYRLEWIVQPLCNQQKLESKSSFSFLHERSLTWLSPGCLLTSWLSTAGALTWSIGSELEWIEYCISDLSLGPRRDLALHRLKVPLCSADLLGDSGEQFVASVGMLVPTVTMRMLQIIRRSSLERHVHSEPYAAVVLSGGYEEAGDNGRFKVSAGNVMFHDAFEGHLNHFSTQGAMVLNLPLGSGDCYSAGIARVSDPDVVVRMAERSGRVAADLLLSLVERCTLQFADWPDELAAELMRCPSLKLSEWGEENGLAPWTLSRGFAQVFGVSAEAFRARSRARRALRSIQETQTSLAIIAAELGFADQAHMTRSIKQLTGVTPQVWRARANGFKTRRHCAV